MDAAKYIASFHAELAIAHGMEVRREEYLDYMTFRANERPLFTEIFGPIVGLKDEWRAQGATEAELDLSAYKWRRPMMGGVPVNTGWMGDAEVVILEETEEAVIFRDNMGRKSKLPKKAATLALPMEYPVKDMDDWLAIKPHYEFSEERFGEGWAEIARLYREAGRVVSVSIPGGYDTPRQLLGDVEACMAFYLQPELVRDILDTVGSTAERVLDRVSATVQIDRLAVHEDMAGKSGPLMGPKLVTEFVKPYYRRIWDMLESRGVRIFDQDSDGDMNPVIDAFLDAGINVMHPFEPAANMDIVASRAKYGTRLAFKGGIDKHVVRKGHDAILAELEYKIPPMVASGGCMLGLDHRIPNGTPLEAYKFYVQKAWEIMDREAAKL